MKLDALLGKPCTSPQPLSLWHPLPRFFGLEPPELRWWSYCRRGGDEASFPHCAFLQWGRGGEEKEVQRCLWGSVKSIVEGGCGLWINLTCTEMLSLFLAPGQLRVKLLAMLSTKKPESLIFLCLASLLCLYKIGVTYQQRNACFVSFLCCYSWRKNNQPFGHDTFWWCQI